MTSSAMRVSSIRGVPRVPTSLGSSLELFLLEDLDALLSALVEAVVSAVVADSMRPDGRAAAGAVVRAQRNEGVVGAPDALAVLGMASLGIRHVFGRLGGRTKGEDASRGWRGLSTRRCRR